MLNEQMILWGESDPCGEGSGPTLRGHVPPFVISSTVNQTFYLLYRKLWCRSGN